jgi:meso-butanediol dehydrogenase/(S,S)-butanediol dehydrogenase/diacetyl reductase
MTLPADSPFDLTGHVALVTGGNGGIGLGMADALAAHGADVAIWGTNPDKNDAAIEQLGRHDVELLSIVCDVGDEDAVVQAMADTIRELGRVDSCFVNAGIGGQAPSFIGMTSDEWRRVMRVNLDGVFYVAQAAARRMRAQGAGVIVNMGSTNGIMGYPFYADYNASKAGVIELTRSMALELAPAVRVVAVCPGYVLTPMQEAEYTPEMMAAVNAKIPLGRHARPEEIAGLFAFLASDEAPYITGQTIVIDGGEFAGGLASR